MTGGLTRTQAILPIHFTSNFRQVITAPVVRVRMPAIPPLPALPQPMSGDVVKSEAGSQPTSSSECRLFDLAPYPFRQQIQDEPATRHQQRTRLCSTRATPSRTRTRIQRVILVNPLPLVPPTWHRRQSCHSVLSTGRLLKVPWATTRVSSTHWRRSTS